MCNVTDMRMLFLVSLTATFLSGQHGFRATVILGPVSHTLRLPIDPCFPMQAETFIQPIDFNRTWLDNWYKICWAFTRGFQHQNVASTTQGKYLTPFFSEGGETLSPKLFTIVYICFHPRHIRLAVKSVLRFPDTIKHFKILKCFFFSERQCSYFHIVFFSERQCNYFHILGEMSVRGQLPVPTAQTDSSCLVLFFSLGMSPLIYPIVHPFWWSTFRLISEQILPRDEKPQYMCMYWFEIEVYC